MVRGVGHAYQCAEPQTVLIKLNAPVTGRAERIDVDDRIRLYDIELHKVQQSRTAGDKFGLSAVAGVRGDAGGSHLHRFRRSLRALIDKSAHGYCVLAVFIRDRACFTASTMFG
jgi:hypothetical protein